MTPLRLLPALVLLLAPLPASLTPGSLPLGADRLQAQSFDWLIHGGTVVDGTGAPRRRADLLLRDGRIAHVGLVDRDTVEVERSFDAEGLAVAPGFIDPHAHGDPVSAPAFSNFLAQGVTTVVLGQDGSGPRAAELAGILRAVENAAPSVNVAYLIGHNTLRREAGVGSGDPGVEGLRRMVSLVEEAMSAGALGLSTGLEYMPGRRADPEELAALAVPVAAHGGVVMSHLRSEDRDRIDQALDELLTQGRRSGAAVHVSHMKVVLGSDPGQARSILGRMAELRAQGLPVTGDVYPYLASFTGIGILFPDWALGPQAYETVVRERRDELAAHLRRRVQARNGPEAMLFGSGPWSGRTLAEAAEATGRPFEELLVELGPGGARAAYFVMDEAVMETFLADPWVVVSSDGSPTMAHPRGYGAFARILDRYTGDDALLSLEEAVRKMTALPASLLGLDEADRVDVPRGALLEGWAGDVAVFDPDGVRDRATFEDPHLLARGMHGVWVSGRMAWTREGPPSVRGGTGGSGSVIRRR